MLGAIQVLHPWKFYRWLGMPWKGNHTSAFTRVCIFLSGVQSQFRPIFFYQVKNPIQSTEILCINIMNFFARLTQHLSICIISSRPRLWPCKSQLLHQEHLIFPCRVDYSYQTAIKGLFWRQVIPGHLFFRYGMGSKFGPI